MTLEPLPVGVPTTIAGSTARARARATRAFACRWLHAGMVSLLFMAGGAPAQSVPDAAASVVHFSTLHSFAFGKDRHSGGARPRPPMQASDGNFYGVSYAGGSRDFGTIYRTKPGGSTVT